MIGAGEAGCSVRPPPRRVADGCRAARRWRKEFGRTGVAARVVLLLGVLAATAVLGLVPRARDGEVRTVSESGDLRPVLAELGAQPGERATLLQFSSAFCAPCRATRRVLGDVARTVPGVAHVEVDAEQHLDLVRRLGVQKTPTTLVLDAGGREVRRAAGQPTAAHVLQALPS